MVISVLGLLVWGAFGQSGVVQASAPAAPTPVSAPAPTIGYADALDCAASYQLHAGEAEMQGLKAAKKARFASSDKAADEAKKLGEAGGKTAAGVDDELMARLDKVSARPPSRAALASAARRCDSLLALTTP